MAGCLSYMTDAVSMIFYTVDNDVASEYYKVARRGRQVFCYTEGLLLQSRLYPNDNADAIALYRNLVQTAVADCLEQPNQWVLKKKRDDISHFLQTADGSKQYPDYSHIGTLSLLKSMEPGERIVIGSRPVCVCCGGTVTSSGRLKCNCAEQVVCSDCGETVSADQARYHDETWLCNGCLRICAHCGHHTHEELIPAFDGRGNVIRICQDCYATALAPCAECCVQAICSLIQGNRFCQKSNEAISQPAAAPALRAA